MKTKNYRHAASLALLFSAVISGLSFVAVKDNLSFISPVWQVALRFLLAGFLFLPIYFARARKMSAHTVKCGIILGIIVFFAFLLSTIGCAFTTASKSSFLTSVYVVAVPLMACPIYKRKPPQGTFFAAALCLLGIALLSFPKISTKIEMPNKGDILTLLGGLCFALHILGASHFSKTEDPLLLTSIQTFSTAICALIAAPVFEGSLPVRNILHIRIVIPLVFLGVFSSALTYILQNTGLKYVPNALASLFLSLESLFGATCSVLLLHETFTPRLFWGGFCIFSSIIIAEFFPALWKNGLVRKPPFGH